MRRQILQFDGLTQHALGSPCVGRVVKISTDGEIRVDFPGNQSGPIRARMAIAGPLQKADQPVLLVFENGDISLPIVTGVIWESNGDASPTQSRDKNEVVLEARKQLTLVCGKSSITLRSDGRIIIKGTEILSRASSTNKIRGASVAIN